MDDAEVASLIVKTAAASTAAGVALQGAGWGVLAAGVVPALDAAIDAVQKRRGSKRRRCA